MYIIWMTQEIHAIFDKKWRWLVMVSKNQLNHYTIWVFFSSFFSSHNSLDKLIKLIACLWTNPAHVMHEPLRYVANGIWRRAMNFIRSARRCLAKSKQKSHFRWIRLIITANKINSVNSSCNFVNNNSSRFLKNFFVFCIYFWYILWTLSSPVLIASYFSFLRTSYESYRFCSLLIVLVLSSNVICFWFLRIIHFGIKKTY